MKKSFLKISFVLLLIGISVSCSDEIISENQNNKSNNSSDVSTSRSIEEAINEANDFIERLEISKSSTRSSKPRSIKEIKCLKTFPATRSDLPDTLMYLINYSENMGFALVGKSKASQGIYAISPEGALNIEDTIENKGLALFIKAAYEDAANASSIIGPPVPEFVYQETNKVTPILHPNIAKWHQYDPYNKYCPEYKGVKLVGCGPVATGMLMAHYRWPEHIGNMDINWNELIEMDDSDKVARFLDILGSKEYLNSFYFTWHLVSGDDTVRSTTDTKLISIFEKCGYNSNNAWLLAPFKNIIDKVFDFMQNGSNNGMPAAPVLIKGSDHVWILDGFIERVKKNKIALSNPNSPWIKANPYLHCVWGFNSNSNGYYLYFCDSDSIGSKSKNGAKILNTYKDIKIIGKFSK